MKSRQKVTYTIYGVIFGLIVFAVLAGVPISTDRNITLNETIDAYSDRWKLESGETVNANDLDISDYGGRIVIEKKLSYSITDKDELCFKSQNTNIKVFIGGRQRYKFESKPNLTGMGYGIAYHEVGISKNDVDKLIRIEIEPVHEGQKRGRLYDISLCSASDFIQMIIRSKLVSCGLSILNIFLGVTFIVAYIGAYKKSDFPFDILAVGISASLSGIWFLIDTNILQLTTGYLYVCRDIRLILPFMLAYPGICSFHSQTEKKRPIYRHLAFFISLISATGIVNLRYLFRIDMLDSFSKFIMAYAIAAMAVLVVMSVENALYCRRTGKKDGMKYLYVGGVIFIVCAIPDLIQYMSSGGIWDNSGVFIRLGSVIYALIMLGVFIGWWMKDNAAIERDRFINRTLQYALSSESPDANIRSILAFLGKELGAKRLCIFEDQRNGKYRGTYEWCREGEEPFGIDMMYLSSEAISGKIYEEFNKNDHRLIVRDSERYKNTIPGFYNLLKTHNLNNLIIGPLEVGGKLFGVCSVIGAPQKKLESVAEIINLISYFLSQLILQRENQSRVMNYTYKDVLSGCGNFTSYKKYLEHDLDTSKAFGCVRCDLSHLYEVNIKEGYEVGDQMVVIAAKGLMEVFGESKVFRIGGTQFIVFDDETEESFFENDVMRVKKLLKENAIDAKLSSVYCLYGTKDINIVLDRLDDLMREKTQEE
ncbi:MAG: GGDEF domain-containing protein [Butyrivibrio sp.]|nr:GGDEF domain-containing protein [Butyrivibrio sp.]